jgi:hypothetical protein
VPRPSAQPRQWHHLQPEPDRNGRASVRSLQRRDRGRRSRAVPLSCTAADTYSAFGRLGQNAREPSSGFRAGHAHVTEPPRVGAARGANSPSGEGIDAWRSRGGFSARAVSKRGLRCHAVVSVNQYAASVAPLDFSMKPLRRPLLASCRRFQRRDQALLDQCGLVALRIEFRVRRLRVREM